MNSSHIDLLRKCQQSLYFESDIKQIQEIIDLIRDLAETNVDSFEDAKELYDELEIYSKLCKNWIGNA